MGCTSAPSALYLRRVSRAAQKALNSVVQRSWMSWMGVASNHSRRSRPSRATVEDAFVSNGNAVAKGNQMPGVPRSSLFIDVGWRDQGTGFYTGLENRFASKVFANDTNANWADSYQITDLRLGVNRTLQGFAVQAFMRANNLFSEKYIGAVAVNDSNGFFYAPAPERNFLFGASVSRQF